MKPLNNYVICRNKDKSKKSESKFETESNDKFTVLEVIAVSKNCSDVLTIGDRVKVSSNAGQKDGEDIILTRADIIYIL